MIHLLKIVSGGQTGVDRGALDFALDYSYPSGGYCPKNRKSEKGKIPKKYPLIELESNEYIDRTKKNISISDGTLIIKDNQPLGEGAMNTLELCKKDKKPFFIAETNFQPEDYDKFISWLKINNIKVLNIAGNRESQSPGIAKKAFTLLEFLLQPDCS
ncbi:MAG: putative molybdenum carrier protein [Bacteroidota bacterium]|nr:putative molybdenum carrier protein [Bacteroidota bacterium]